MCKGRNHPPGLTISLIDLLLRKALVQVSAGLKTIGPGGQNQIAVAFPYYMWGFDSSDRVSACSLFVFKNGLLTLIEALGFRTETLMEKVEILLFKQLDIVVF
ncbi:MAG: hypothetical protein RPU64_05390 [Candidatus Sedimenticola sp. (ex Thyasira tokunagai)]